ncbi:MAG: hypothetical protein A2Y21_09120 [Clostridiales bacterium GWC2_40_7]|nr:MAG: hypothetical protein A2Y21_09120 [Clostridiales bacterium GWC2_40_7]
MLNVKKKYLIISIVFFLPALLIYVTFFLYPVVSGIFYSFTNWQGMSKTIKFVGLKNYVELFGDRRFIASIINTFEFALIYTVLQNGFGIILALLMDMKVLFKNVYRSIIYMPSVISTLVVGFVWTYIYNPTLGVNTIFEAIGLGAIAPQWTGDIHTALLSLIIASLSASVGTSMVLYLAGLQDIPQELYETAGIDGVNWYQKIIHITLPLLAPAITIGVVLTTIWSLKVFEIVFVMTQGGPGYATETMATVMYDYAFRTSRFAYGTAIGVILFLIVLVLTMVQLKVLQKREVQY